MVISKTVIVMMMVVTMTVVTVMSMVMIIVIIVKKKRNHAWWYVQHIYLVLISTLFRPEYDLYCCGGYLCLIISKALCCGSCCHQQYLGGSHNLPLWLLLQPEIGLLANFIAVVIDVVGNISDKQILLGLFVFFKRNSTGNRPEHKLYWCGYSSFQG